MGCARKNTARKKLGYCSVRLQRTRSATCQHEKDSGGCAPTFACSHECNVEPPAANQRASCQQPDAPPLNVSTHQQRTEGLAWRAGDAGVQAGVLHADGRDGVQHEAVLTLGDELCDVGSVGEEVQADLRATEVAMRG